MPDWVSKTTVWECVFAIRGPRSEFANSCCKWVQIFGSTTLRCACSHQKPVRQTALASLLRPNLSIYGLARLVHGRMTGEWQLLSEHKPNMHHFNIYRSITCKKKTHRRVVSVQRGGGDFNFKPGLILNNIAAARGHGGHAPQRSNAGNAPIFALCSSSPGIEVPTVQILSESLRQPQSKHGCV